MTKRRTLRYWVTPMGAQLPSVRACSLRLQISRKLSLNRKIGLSSWPNFKNYTSRESQQQPTVSSMVEHKTYDFSTSNKLEYTLCDALCGNVGVRNDVKLQLKIIWDALGKMRTVRDDFNHIIQMCKQSINTWLKHNYDYSTTQIDHLYYHGTRRSM